MFTDGEEGPTCSVKGGVKEESVRAVSHRL